MLKWLAVGLAAAAIALSAAPAGAAGYRTVEGPEVDGKPLTLAIWYPSAAKPTPQAFGSFHPSMAVNGEFAGKGLPLIIISHGTGGSGLSHYDTAIALADAGFVVVTFDHPGDNYQDPSAAGFRRDLIDRPRQVKAVVDYMLGAWPERGRLDPGRVGMFGFSLGGFTTLVEIGGRPDLRRNARLCAGQTASPDCAFVRDRHGDSLDTAPLPAPVWTHDARIRAAVVVAPAASYNFGPGALKAVHAPVQLWSAANDQQAPAQWNSDLVRDGLPQPPEVHVVPGAGHTVFLTPDICGEAPAEGCAAFHQRFNAAVVAFFGKTLAER